MKEETYIEELNKADVNSYLQKILEIHFDPIGGSEHWLELEKKLNIDVKREITSLSDLVILEEALIKWMRNNPETQEFSETHLKSPNILEHIIPKRYLRDKLDVCLSSATKGITKIIPWSESSSKEVVKYYEFYFKYNKFPMEEKWLIIGPYGLFESHICSAVKKFGGIPISIGIESWGSKNIKDEKKIMERFEPTMGRIKDVFKEGIGVVATATEMAELLPKFVDISNIKALYLTGTGTNFHRVENLRKIYNLKSIGVGYGHSMWGPAFHVDDGTGNLNYYSHKLQCVQKIVDSQDITKELKYYQKGRVKSYILRNEFFWINLDRDFGVKIPGTPPFNWEGVRNVESD